MQVEYKLFLNTFIFNRAEREVMSYCGWIVGKKPPLLREYSYWGRKKEKKKGAWLPMKFLQQTHLVS